MQAGRDTAGIFSLAAKGQKVVAVGGDFSLPGQSSRGTVSISRDGGYSWAEPDTPTYGYRSVCQVLGGVVTLPYSGLVLPLSVMTSWWLLG